MNLAQYEIDDLKRDLGRMKLTALDDLRRIEARTGIYKLCLKRIAEAKLAAVEAEIEYLNAAGYGYGECK
mgnify:CR=1 FL=1